MKKLIPLKFHKQKNGYLVAWHWNWSITWRWIVKWRKGNYPLGRTKFDNKYNGHGWRHYSLGRFGLIEVVWQPNMKREGGL